MALLTLWLVLQFAGTHSVFPILEFRVVERYRSSLRWEGRCTRDLSFRRPIQRVYGSGAGYTAEGSDRLQAVEAAGLYFYEGAQKTTCSYPSIATPNLEKVHFRKYESLEIDYSRGTICPPKLS